MCVRPPVRFKASDGVSQLWHRMQCLAHQTHQAVSLLGFVGHLGQVLGFVSHSKQFTERATTSATREWRTEQGGRALSVRPRHGGSPKSDSQLRGAV